MDVFCGNVVFITSFIFTGTVARALQSFFNLQSLLVPFQKQQKAQEQKKGTNLFTLSGGADRNDKSIYRLGPALRSRYFIPSPKNIPASGSLVMRSTTVQPLEMEHLARGLTYPMPLDHLYNRSFSPQFQAMPLTGGSSMYPIQVVNSHLIPMHPLLPRVYNVPLAQMSCPQYPIPKVSPYFGLQAPIHSIDNCLDKHVSFPPVYNYFSGTKNTDSKDNFWLTKRNAAAVTTSSPYKSILEALKTANKQYPVAQITESKIKIPTNLYKSIEKNKEPIIQTIPLNTINNLHLNEQGNNLMNFPQYPISYFKQKSIPSVSNTGTMLLPQSQQSVPILYGIKPTAIANPMVFSPSYPYFAQMSPNLRNPFLLSLPMVGYGYPNSIPHLPTDPLGNPYLLPQIPSVPLNNAPLSLPLDATIEQEREERKQLLNLIDGNPKTLISSNPMKTLHFTPPLMDSFLSENIKIKRQNELSVVSKISALKAKEKMAEMNRRALYQKAKAADEEYVRKLNKELNLITEWKLANLSAEEAFQKLMANKRRLTEQEREVHRVKEAENELYSELLQSQAELAIADMQLIPSIPSEVILRQFLSGMNYDRPMDIPPAV
ncbi:uncharacterized protein isoform X3 [Rhodnius prolixus]|uniref:uncharacterized protein isoform X3 n=1 Tax=Rhodnius prolixus TaxID=13249 RepID=UPI003D189935